MDIDIKKLLSEDFDAFSDLIRLFEEVFEMEDFKMPNYQHLQSLLGKPDFFTLVAKCDNKVIGGLTVYILDRYYSTKPIAYICDVGVTAKYQRKGVGKKFIPT